ncbi:MAG: hypothetical protein GFGODING_02723 [Flavobacteriales bacterium]|nr:hypothetical protein [Flavobacteriales bacterium]
MGPFLRLLVVVLLFWPWAGLHAQWQWNPIGAPGTVYAMVEHDNSMYFGYYQGSPSIYRSIDHGNTLVPSDSGITTESLWWLESHQGVLFSGALISGSYRSTDDGQSWQPWDMPQMRGMELHDDTLYCCQWGSPSVSWSVDQGITWTATSPIPGVGGLWPLHSHGGKLFLGCQSGGVYSLAHAYADWTQMNNGLVGSAYALASMGDVLFAGTNAGVYRSLDNGDSWSLSGMDDTLFYALHATDTALFAGGDHGVFMSTDTGNTWASLNNGFLNGQVVVLTSDDQYLYAGTLGGGAFRYGGVVTPVATIEKVSAWIKVFPNPATGFSTISLEGLGNGPVVIDLVRADGRLAMNLFQGRLAGGSGAIEWNTSGLPSGVYRCRVSYDKGISTTGVTVLH